MANLEVRLIILEDIKKALEDDEYLAKAQKFDEETKKGEFTVASNSTVKFKGIIYVTKTVDLTV